MTAASDLVVSLDPGQVTSEGNRNDLIEKLSDAVKKIQKGKIDKAIKILEKAIERTDGCPLRGSPDGGNGAVRDWITDCAAQTEAYETLNLALDALTP